MCLSDQMLQYTDEVTLLHQLASYHVAYHLNEVHFIQYRALGSIFPDLHGLVVNHFSHQSEGTAQGQSSTDIAEACYTHTLSSLQLHTECILRCEILLIQYFCHILQPLDVLAVRLLLERIAPKPLTPQNKVEFWNIQNLRNIYIKKLRECQTTVDGILQYSQCNTINDATSLRWAFSLLTCLYICDSLHVWLYLILPSLHCMWATIYVTICNLVFSSRVQWHSVRAVQMYIEHLILPLSLHEKMTEEIIKGAFRLWSVCSHCHQLVILFSAVQTCNLCFGIGTNKARKSYNFQ